MAKPPRLRPTDAELAILRILWQRGPSTVRQVHEALSRVKDTGYTTVLKIMQIMADKRLLTRDESSRTHIYAPACSEEHTQQQLVGDMLDRVFGGSARNLVMQALSAKKASPAEIAEIRKLLDNMEKHAS